MFQRKEGQGRVPAATRVVSVPGLLVHFVPFLQGLVLYLLQSPLGGFTVYGPITTPHLLMLGSPLTSFLQVYVSHTSAFKETPPSGPSSLCPSGSCVGGGVSCLVHSSCLGAPVWSFFTIFSSWLPLMTSREGEKEPSLSFSLV